jgi:hypothetical protein
MTKNITYLRTSNAGKQQRKEIFIRKLRSKARSIYSQYCFVCSATKEVLRFSREEAKKYHYFLYLDVEHYPLSVNQKVLP